MVSLKRDETGPRGEPAGSITTDPQEVDKVVRRSWGQVYAGNVEGDLEAQADEFTEAYERQLYRGDQFPVHDITANDVFEACRWGRKSASNTFKERSISEIAIT